MVENGVSPKIAKWVYIAVIRLVVVLAVVVGVGLHVPRG